MTEKEVWFIRHGESAANAGLKTDDAGLIPLTEKGIAQSIALAEKILHRPELIIHSKFLRTIQTAHATIQKFVGVPVEEWQGLHEFDFLSPLKCVNTTMAERRPMVEDFWNRAEAHFVHGEGAESFYQFRHRIFNDIYKLQDRPETFILVFTHGHVMRGIWEYFLNKNTDITDASMRVSRDTMGKVTVQNTAIFKAKFDGKTWQVIDPKIELPGI